MTIYSINEQGEPYIYQIVDRNPLVTKLLLLDTTIWTLLRLVVPKKN